MFCMFGASRTHELPTIRVTDIARYDDMYYVTVPSKNTKTSEKNSFAIRGPMLDIVRKYENLRPATATSDRFFLNYQKGKCTVQNIGKGKFYKMPNRIAEYLQLPNAHLYTGKSKSFIDIKCLFECFSFCKQLGHSFRRTSTTIYANTGASIEAIKRHTGHKSTAVCEGYIADSIGYKKNVADAIVLSITGSSSNSTATSTVIL